MTLVADRSAAGHEAARRAMIDSQLRTSGVNAEWVLRRMDAVARERFVPESVQGFAYIDRAIALGDGRYLAAPEVQGMMLQEARPTSEDRALVVDGGSGYLAELLRPLVGSLDIISPKAAVAGGKGGDYSLVLIDGAVEHIPPTLTKRIAEPGRVVTGWLRNGVSCLAIGRRAGDEVALLPLAEIGIPALPEFARPKEWSF